MSKQRQQERFSQEINSAFDRYQAAFMEQFMNPTVDPEADEFQDFTKRLIHKWKTFCHINHLMRPAFLAMEKFIETVLSDYKGRKAGTISDPIDEPEVKKEAVTT